MRMLLLATFRLVGLCNDIGELASAAIAQRAGNDSSPVAETTVGEVLDRWNVPRAGRVSNHKAGGGEAKVINWT